jgi:hypothetical protein
LTNQNQKYWGGVLAANGKVYCIPYNEDKVLVIDPIGDTYYYPSGLTSIISNTEKWKGGVLAPNGKIYCANFSVSVTLVIDTNNDSFNYINKSNTANGVVLAQNNLIYFIPSRNVTDVEILNPENESIITIPNCKQNGNELVSGVLAQNGNIYCAPAGDNISFNNYVFVINTINNTAGYTIAGLTNINTGSNNGNFFGPGALSPNNKIYFPPSDFADHKITLVIDTNTNIGLTGVTSLNNVLKTSSSVLASDGKIYCINGFNSNILSIINPDTNTGITIAQNFTNTNQLLWKGSVLTPNGIYCVPYQADYILKIKTGLPIYPNWMLDPYFNKF